MTSGPTIYFTELKLLRQAGTDIGEVRNQELFLEAIITVVGWHRYRCGRWP